MTQPAPPAQQQTNQRTAILAGLLASTAPLAAVAAGFAIVAGLTPAIASRLLTKAPATLRTPTDNLGPAARQVATAEPTYRAAYLLNAAERVKAAIAAGKTLDEALTDEERFTRQHLAAQANRAKAAAAVDHAAATHRSGLLGWKARMDSRTSAECADANGKNFSIFNPPLIGLPGSVHPHCRCVPVPAFAGAGLVDESSRATRKVAVA